MRIPRIHRKLALQLFLSFSITMAIVSPAPVWYALSYASVTPPLSLVFMVFLVSSSQGGSTLACINMALGIALGGALSLAFTYLSYAAASSSWTSSSVTRAAVYATLFSLTMGLLNTLRWRRDATNQLFLFTCVGAVFGGSLAIYFELDTYSAVALYWHVLLLALLACAVTLLCSWFVFPVTSAELYRAQVGTALCHVGTAIAAIRALLLSPIDESTGKLSRATGHIDCATGTDAGLGDSVTDIRTALRGARQSLLNSRNFHIPVSLEIDLYNRPHIFPKTAFMHVKMCVGLAISTTATLVRPLTSGSMDLRLLRQHPTLRLKLLDVLVGMEELCFQLARCISPSLSVGDDTINTTTLSGNTAQQEAKQTENVESVKSPDATPTQTPFQAADATLASLDASWLLFLDAAVDAIANCGDADAYFGLRGLSAFLYLVGSRLRSIYLAVACAVFTAQPEAVPTAIHRMEVTPGWVKSSDAFKNPLQSSEVALKALHKAAEGVDADVRATLHAMSKRKRLRKLKGGVAKDVASASASSFQEVIQAAHATGASPFRRQHRRRRSNAPRLPWYQYHRLLPNHIVYGIQYGIAMGIVIILSVIPAVSRTLFHGRGIDAVITVCVTYLPTIGGVHDKGINRIYGTAGAAVWSYLMLGLAYGVSGGTTAGWDENSPEKFVIAALSVAVWAALCELQWLRHPQYAYAWMVAALTVPLVAVTSLRAPEPPWESVGWRILNVMIGVVVVWVVAWVVFPMSARRVVAANFGAALESLSDLVRELPNHLQDQEQEQEQERSTTNTAQQPSSPFSPLQPIAGTEAFRQSFYAPIHVAPISLSLRVQRALSDIQQFIPALEAEYLVFSRPRRMPKGVTSSAKHAAQLLLDTLNLAYALKMENAPLHPWTIPSLQYNHMTVVVNLVGDTLDALRDVVHDSVNTSTGTTTSRIRPAVECLRKVEEAVTKQVEETLACAAERQDDVLLEMHVVMLIYIVSIALAQQLRIVCAATAKAFVCFDHEHKQNDGDNGSEGGDVETADNMGEEEEELLNGNRPPLFMEHGPEYFMARILEGNYMHKAQSNHQQQQIVVEEPPLEIVVDRNE